jgi:hypothetical protein
LVAGVATAAIIRGGPLWDIPSSAGAALGAITIISALFIVLYLAAVILLHGGLAPLRQLTGLLREFAPSRKSSTPAAEAV